MDLEAGVGQRQDRLMEVRRKGSRGLAERQELEQLGSGAAPVGRVIEECAHGIDEGAGWGRDMESFEHFVRGVVQGWGGGLRPSEGVGVAGPR